MSVGRCNNDLMAQVLAAHPNRTILRFHAIEGHCSKVFSDWRFVFIGLEWWAGLMRGRVSWGNRGRSKQGSLLSIVSARDKASAD
jgi:hypothetical protein